METTDTWAAFGSEYIKAIDVLNNTDEYAIVNVSSKTETRNEVTRDVLHLHLEKDNGKLKKLFGCNATNTQAVQEACPISPKDAIGRKITFNKVKVQKPGTDEVVDGLRVQFVKIQSEVKESIESDVKSDGTI